jgi:hypothetical protein
MKLKINQNERNDVLAKEQMNVDMVAELNEESEKVKKYLDNIMLIGALKGYKVNQVTEDYTFWRNYNITFQRDTDKFYVQFSIKRNNKLDSFEIKSSSAKLTDILTSFVGEEIKTIPTAVFFTYSHKDKMLMLEVLHSFILDE